MAEFASFKSNFSSVANEFTKFKQEIRKEVIENGLDDTLKKSVQELKRELQFIVNEKLRANPVDPGKPLNESTLIQPPIKIPKSKEALLKQLTGIDVLEHNKKRDKASTYGSNQGQRMLVAAQPSTGRGSSSRVELKIPMGSGDSVESHYTRAKASLGGAVFSFPKQGGKQEFIMPTEDISEEIKIDCSTQNAVGNGKDPYYGKTPQERFQRLVDMGQQYASWSIKQRAVEKMQNSGVNLSKIIDNLLEGDYDSARDYLNTFPKEQRKVVQDLDEKITQLETNDKLSPDIQTYNNIISLIRNLKIKKKIMKKTVRYSLVSNYGNIDDKQEKDFEFEMRRQIAVWKNVNVDKWVGKLISKIVSVAKKFYGGKK